MLVVVVGLDSAVNAFHLGGPQKREQDDLLTSTDTSISSQEVVPPSSLTDSDASQVVVPPFLTVIAPQIDFSPSSTDQTVSDGNNMKTREMRKVTITGMYIKHPIYLGVLNLIFFKVQNEQRYRGIPKWQTGEEPTWEQSI